MLDVDSAIFDTNAERDAQTARATEGGAAEAGDTMSAPFPAAPASVIGCGVRIAHRYQRESGLKPAVTTAGLAVMKTRTCAGQTRKVAGKVRLDVV